MNIHREPEAWNFAPFHSLATREAKCCKSARLTPISGGRWRHTAHAHEIRLANNAGAICNQLRAHELLSITPVHKATDNR